MIQWSRREAIQILEMSAIVQRIQTQRRKELHKNPFFCCVAEYCSHSSGRLKSTERRNINDEAFLQKFPEYRFIRVGTFFCFCMKFYVSAPCRAHRLCFCFRRCQNAAVPNLFGFIFRRLCSALCSLIHYLRSPPPPWLIQSQTHLSEELKSSFSMWRQAKSFAHHAPSHQHPLEAVRSFGWTEGT